MLRRLVLALCVLVVSSGSLLAAEIRGTIKTIDPEKNTIILTVGNEDQTFEVAPTTPVFRLVTVGRRRRASTQLQQIGQGVQSLQMGLRVTMTTETQEGVEAVTQIRQNNVTTSYYRGRGRRRR